MVADARRAVGQSDSIVKEVSVVHCAVDLLIYIQSTDYSKHALWLVILFLVRLHFGKNSLTH